MRMVQPVEYEWRPIICGDCRGVGHNAEECRKKKLEVQKLFKRGRRGEGLHSHRKRLGFPGSLKLHRCSLVLLVEMEILEIL